MIGDNQMWPPELRASLQASVKRLVDERDRYRDALQHIADWVPDGHEAAATADLALKGGQTSAHEPDVMFVVVCKDRHRDDDIYVYTTPELAMARVKKFIQSYGDRYKWEAEEVTGWLYNAFTDDDGPKVHVEERRVDL
jgi:hypothetical protein